MYRTGDVAPDFKVVAFPHMYELEDTPVGMDHDDQWEDHAGANRFFMEKWLYVTPQTYTDISPGITIESKRIWDARAASNQLFRIPMIVMANRWAGHRGPSAAWKPWGDVLRMPVHPNYLLNLRARVLKGYRGPVLLKPSRRPRVKYLTRQDSTRRLTYPANEALVAALQSLHDEGLVEFSVIHFTDGDSFHDQIAHMATTDFLVGVHGNGLTHSLWLTPGPGKAVFELQPKPCSLVSYRIFVLTDGRTTSVRLPSLRAFSITS